MRCFIQALRRLLKLYTGDGYLVAGQTKFACEISGFPQGVTVAFALLRC